MKMIKTGEAARRLGVSPVTLHDWCVKGIAHPLIKGKRNRQWTLKEVERLKTLKNGNNGSKRIKTTPQAEIKVKTVNAEKEAAYKTLRMLLKIHYHSSLETSSDLEATIEIILGIYLEICNNSRRNP